MLPSVPAAEVPSIRLPFVDAREQGALPDGFDQAFPLTIDHCELLAARRSPLAAVLEVEQQNQGSCQSCSNVDPCLQDSINGILAANAGYQRNLAAEQALRAYLGLVEVYLQNQIVAETIEEIEGLEEVLAKLQGEGLLRDVDPETLARKKLDAVSQRNELLFNFEKLNGNLRSLLGLDESVHPIWTACQIEAWQLPTDLDQEIATAWESRSDLAALEQLTLISNDQLLDTLRNSVRSASPLAGLVLERRLFGGFFQDNSAEMDKLRSQLGILQAARNELVQSTVAESFYAIHRNHQQIQVERQRLESLRKSEARLEARRQVGPIKVEDVLTVKSEILQSRSSIIRSAVDLQRSWIQLKAAQGLLGRQTEDVSM